MPSAIDATKPQAGQAFTEDMRANFSTAAGEISALQEAIASAGETGVLTVGSGTSRMVISVDRGVPGGATPGFDAIGSLYTDSNGTPGSALYISNGDGTWSVIG
jgi:hypothetical protein